MSLRAKLIAAYAVSLLVVVGGFGVGMVVALRDTLEKGAREQVEARANAVASVIEFEGGAFVIEPSSGLMEQYGQGSGWSFTVRDEHGTLLLHSPHADTAGSARTATATLRAVKSGDAEEPHPPTLLLIECTRDLHDVDFAVASLIELLAWLGPSVIAVSLIAALLLARRALRPIDVIARTATTIGHGDLARRVPVRGRDELAALATTLNQTFDRLQAAVEREARFAADASHEIRTPLAAIAGHVELALSRPRSAEELRTHLAEIGAASREMQELVDGLLTLARAEHEQPSDQMVDLTALCAEAVDRAASQASDAGIELSCSGHAETCGDPRGLSRVIQNLLANAIRYNRPGGKVALRCAMHDEWATLVVEDDGIGIPEEALPHLGERFFRVDDSRSRRTGGIGLGLSIVRAIVHVHRGRLGFRSETGRGTTVTVELPRSIAPRPVRDDNPIDRESSPRETPAAAPRPSA
ncbi:MAG: HAMP domain-containing sensor histidine kinase [Planctomycetota bacterium]